MCLFIYSLSEDLTRLFDANLHVVSGELIRKVSTFCIFYRKQMQRDMRGLFNEELENKQPNVDCTLFQVQFEYQRYYSLDACMKFRCVRQRGDEVKFV